MSFMNIIEFAESLQAKMKQQLDNLNMEQDEIIKIGKVLTFIRGLITELKAFTRNYKFQNQPEEIQFFKEVKPVFFSQYFYYKKVFAIRLFDSFKDAKTRQANYYRLLAKLEDYVEKNLEFYEYCMSGDTFMDSHYFTRHRNHKSLDRDENFSTGYDTKLAKLLANELVKKDVFKLIDHLDSVYPVLAWTGSKTDLIELIYGLQAANVINNGNVEIKAIASAFESVFGIELGNYYRVFQDIRLRKSGQTNFLDQVRAKLSQKTDE